MTFLFLVLVYAFGPFLLFFLVSIVFGMVTKAKGNKRPIHFAKYLAIPLLLCDTLYAFIIHLWEGFPDRESVPLTFDAWFTNFITALPVFIVLGLLFFYIGVFIKFIYKTYTKKS